MVGHPVLILLKTTTSLCLPDVNYLILMSTILRLLLYDYYSVATAHIAECYIAATLIITINAGTL